ncbi:hypothetical protein SLEP1_g5298 [Rubroshorea leprosula]|uniref:Cytochrome P450 n=1 Tax=Rubroshorea leprosula TaxID=152421 RepID=A0AAV5HRI0_9ROSI|nr:hypothetical protein SLEP1_g5298 [Rubroshorea leprosula]
MLMLGENSQLRAQVGDAIDENGPHRHRSRNPSSSHSYSFTGTGGFRPHQFSSHPTKSSNFVVSTSANNSRDLKQIPNWKHKRNSSQKEKGEEGGTDDPFAPVIGACPFMCPESRLLLRILAMLMLDKNSQLRWETPLMRVDITGAEVGTLPLPILIHSQEQEVFVLANSLLIRPNPRTLFRALQPAVITIQGISSKSLTGNTEEIVANKRREKKEGLMIPLFL